MALDAGKVLVGRADQQATTGAVRCGAIIEAADVPTTFEEAETALNAMTINSGYVSADGLSALNTEFSTNDITEWNGATVRTVLETFSGSIEFALIQQDYENWCMALGEDSVTRTAATTTHGEQLHVGIGTHLPPVRSWGFAMKDGDARIIILMCRGQVTNMDSMTFAATEAISLPLTVTGYDDGTGESIHIYLDDGKKTS